MTGVSPPETLGHQHFDFAAKQLFPFVAEQVLGLGIDERDFPIAVGHDHGVGRGFEQAPELRLSLGEFAGPLLDAVLQLIPRLAQGVLGSFAIGDVD